MKKNLIILSIFVIQFLFYNNCAQDDSSVTNNKNLICESDWQCPDNKKCKQGICVLVESDNCIADSDCPYGYICIFESGLCKRHSASGNNYYTKPECIKNSNCEINFYCENRQCIQKNLDENCSSDNDCENGQICYLGLCKNPECNPETDECESDYEFNNYNDSNNQTNSTNNTQNSNNSINSYNSINSNNNETEPVTGNIGSPCATDNDCGLNKECSNELPGGYCTMQCGNLITQCPNDSFCWQIILDSGICLKKCESDLDCRNNYSCITTDFGNGCFSR